MFTSDYLEDVLILPLVKITKGIQLVAWDLSARQPTNAYFAAEVIVYKFWSCHKVFRNHYFIRLCKKKRAKTTKMCKSKRTCVLWVNVGSLCKGSDKQVHHSIYVHWCFPYEFQWPVYMTQLASPLLVQHEKAAWVHNLRVAAAASISVRGDSSPTTWARTMCLKDNYSSIC